MSDDFESHRYNESTNREVQEALVSVAVYECDEPFEGAVRSTRIGLVKDSVDAEKWLAGDDPENIESFIRLECSPLAEPPRDWLR